jgi:hypothetical protein
MSHSLRDIKKINSKKYEGVDETLLRQNFSINKLVNFTIRLGKNIKRSFAINPTHFGITRAKNSKFLSQSFYFLHARKSLE